MEVYGSKAFGDNHKNKGFFHIEFLFEGRQSLTALETLWIMNSPRLVFLLKHLTSLNTPVISDCDHLKLMNEEDYIQDFRSL